MADMGTDSSSKDETKPMCKYGESCYRKNKQHLSQFRHTKRKGDARTAVKENPAKKRKIESPTKQKKSSSDSSTKITSPGDEEDDVKKIEKDEEERKESESKDEELPPAPSDVREEIKMKFLVEMPEDFYEFWEFCKSLDARNPTDALLEPLGLQLVGPFDILAGKFKKHKGKRPCYVLHWRYYYDPPEFMTVIKGDDTSQYHLGYYRDDPSEMPAFVASNSANKNSVLAKEAENLFGAVKLCIVNKLNLAKDKKKKTSLNKLHESLLKWTKKSDISLESRSKAMKARDKKVVAKTFHGAGIVVPVVDDVGYRPLPETDGSLKKILKKIVDSSTDDERLKNFDDLQEIMTFIQFANDECDYGEGYELGIDLFCNGSDIFHASILNLLPLAYTLLGRDEYGEIITKHLKYRNKTNLSQLK